jgi:uncharacterized protein YoxC
MNEVILGIGVAVFTVYVAFQIGYLVSMKRTGDRLSAFLTNTEGKVDAALSEITGTLENLRKVSGDIGAVTADVREIADTVVSLERTMRGIYQHAKEGLGSAAEANIAGLRAGITAGVATLVRNIQEGRSDDHERGTER